MLFMDPDVLLHLWLSISLKECRDMVLLSLSQLNPSILIMCKEFCILLARRPVSYYGKFMNISRLFIVLRLKKKQIC